MRRVKISYEFDIIIIVLIVQSHVVGSQAPDLGGAQRLITGCAIIPDMPCSYVGRGVSPNMPCSREVGSQRRLRTALNLNYDSAAGPNA